MPIVPADVEINEALVKTLLFEQFKLDAKKLEKLGEGWDNVVFLVNEELVFRFPKRSIARDLLIKEIKVLQALKNRLPLTTPYPEYVCTKSENFFGPFYGHKFLVGTSGSAVKLTDEECQEAAYKLGQFLRALHDLDINAVGLVKDDLVPFFDRCNYEKSKKVFLERLSYIESSYDVKAYNKKFLNILEDAKDYRPEKISLIHGDMYHRHLIFRENKLKAVIDWGDCSLGDPTGDLGIIYQFFPKHAWEYFFRSYGPVDEKDLAYARFIGLYFAVALLWFGHDRGDQDLIKTSLWTFETI